MFDYHHDRLIQIYSKPCGDIPSPAVPCHAERWVRVLLNVQDPLTLTYTTMTPVRQIGASDVIILISVLWLFSKVVRSGFGRRGAKSTPLKGPNSKSLIFGLTRYILDSEDPAVLYEQWAKEYGTVFRLPTIFRSSRTVICDPKAIAHFYSKETFGYVQTGISRILIERLVSNRW